MNKEKISDELLDNLDNDNLDNESVRKPYFSWLEGIIVLGHLILIFVALESMYSVGFPIENLFEEFIIITLSISSILYVYICRKNSIHYHRLPFTPIHRPIQILRLANLIISFLLVSIGFFAIIYLLFNHQSFTSEDWALQGMMLLFFVLGLCQFYYTTIVMSAKLQ